MILAISGSLSVFEIPYIMTGGATGTETFVIQTVKLAFQFNKTGLASAAAVVLLLIVLAGRPGCSGGSSRTTGWTSYDAPHARQPRPGERLGATCSLVARDRLAGRPAAAGRRSC